MSVWIRSQDKTSLVECEAIYIIKQVDDVYCMFINCSILGRYSTKEKVIKVLDMIEDHKTSIRNIDDDLVFRSDIVSDINQSQVTLLNNTFQMPEDNEVEIDETKTK